MEPLSDAEICERFGPLFREFDEALRRDPHVLADIVEAMAERRRIRRVRGGPPEPEPEPPPDPEPDPRELRNQKIVRLRGMGLTVAEIAEDVGLSQTGVNHVLAAHGVEAERVRSDKWDRRDQRILRLHEKGLKGTEIARLLDVSKATVSMRLKKIKQADTA